MLLLTCLFVGIGLVTAQTQKVTGVVISEEDGQPVVGASVLVKGTNLGTITDVDGNFTLSSVPSSAKTLQISYIGMQTQEVAIKPSVKVVLKSDSQMIDEVMVVAYGTAKKSSITGSAAKVSGEKISLKNPSEVSKALAGEVAGVQVINTSGQPGTNATIRIRGIGSANSSSSPLYVVDGIPFGSDLSGISPSDIESTTVLKDASATALYGTRAANGVILITTKKGEKGKTKVEAEFKYGANVRIIPTYDTMDSPERFIETTWESMKNGFTYYYGFDNPELYANKYLWDKSNGIAAGYNMWDTADLIDPTTGKIKSGVNRKYNPEKWEDYIFRTGQKMQGDVKISGGSEKTTHFTSLSYLKDEGYYIESDFTRFSARSNINHELYSWLKSNMNLAYSYMESNAPGQTDDANNGFQFVNFMPSMFPVFERDENGNKIEDNVVGGYKYDYGMRYGNGRPYGAGINPAGAVLLDRKLTKSHQFNGSAMLEARFLKDFKLTANLGMQYLGISIDGLTNPYYGDAEGLGRIEKESDSYISLMGNQILTYTKSFAGHHNIDAFVAHESYYHSLSYMGGLKSKLILPGSLEWSNAVIMGNMDSDTYGYSLESYFGQVRYDYDEKYHFNASLRRDGSSRFSKGNKWGTFGSVGAAWVITKENFMENVEWLHNLKYKISYGVLGNQDFNVTGAAGVLPYYDLYTVGNLMDQPSLTFNYKGNKDLTWEKSYSFNTGIEFDINGVLDGEIEYFNKTTKDMLYLKQVAPSLGYASYPVNDGQLRNQGIEFSLNAHIVNTNDVKFDVRLNGGYYKNEMTKMPVDDTTKEPKPYEVHGLYGWAKGHSLYDFYIREYAGVDSETGVALYNQYYNVKADGSRVLITDMEKYKANNQIEKLEVETTDDWSKATQKFVDKSAIPAISGGFGFDLSVKGFDVSTTFTYSIGGYAYDAVYATLMGDNAPGATNWHNDIENRWQKPGDITDVPRLCFGTDQYANATSTRFLTNRSYLNLANARIGYTFPKSLLPKNYLKSLSIYVSGDNLFTVSKRKGFVAMSSVSGASDRSQYIPLSTIMGGIKVEF
ncbi:SusC/RagA family TonB-linked outer membrane protein [Bacteroides sp.]